MTEDQTIKIIYEVVGRTGLHYSALAAICGVSSTTTRMVLASGRLPARSHARQRLEAFARTNASAHRRGELRFVDD